MDWFDYQLSDSEDKDLGCVYATEPWRVTMTHIILTILISRGCKSLVIG
jgi:hypothetical protein